MDYEKNIFLITKKNKFRLIACSIKSKYTKFFMMTALKSITITDMGRGHL